MRKNNHIRAPPRGLCLIVATRSFNRDFKYANLLASDNATDDSAEILLAQSTAFSAAALREEMPTMQSHHQKSPTCQHSWPMKARTDAARQRRYPLGEAATDTKVAAQPTLLRCTADKRRSCASCLLMWAKSCAAGFGPGNQVERCISRMRLCLSRLGRGRERTEVGAGSPPHA